MRSTPLLLLASAVLTSAINTLPDFGLGNWTITRYTTDSAPSVGATWRDVTAQYSGSDTVVTCHWSQYHGKETGSCSDPLFSYVLGQRPRPELQEIIITQEVTVNGVRVNVTGDGSVDLRCRLGAGYACQLDGVAVVVATTTV